MQASSPQGRFHDGAASIDGQEFHHAEAYGKHLFAHFDEDVLHIHLGLIGKFRPAPAGSPARDSIRLRLENDDALWDLTGPQDCRLVTPAELDDITAGLGPDPLRRRANGDDFADAMQRRKVPVAAALLDQKVIAGIGNVYRAEFLFLLGIEPHRAANSLDEQELQALWLLAREQLRVGVRLNRIVTVTTTDSGTTAGRLQRDDALYVYQRDGLPCRRCGTEISIGKIAGRSCWWCHVCQR